MKTLNVLNFEIFNDELSNIDISKKTIINTLNPHSYCILKNDKLFQKALIESDVLLPDGSGIVLASRLLNGRSMNKIAGYDVFIHLLDKMNKKSGSVFFLGSSQETIHKIKNRLSIEYPNLSADGYSPPFAASFSKKESFNMCNMVNSFQPDILFVGMTAPKQEKWVNEYKNKLMVKNICCIGAVFDFYSGNIRRASTFWIKLGLEWLPRFINEPRRLFKRNFISTPKFIFEILSYKLFGKGIL